MGEEDAVGAGVRRLGSRMDQGRVGEVGVGGWEVGGERFQPYSNLNSAPEKKCKKGIPRRIVDMWTRTRKREAIRSLNHTETRNAW